MMERLLDIRKELKGRKPTFIRQDTQKRKKLSLKWRKPKGIHSKIRHQFRGKMRLPSPGFKSPIKVKGLHSSGLKIVRVFSVDEVKKRKDAVQEFGKGGRQDLVDKETAELKILETYLPEEMSQEELEKIVKKVIDGLGPVSARDFGKIMGLIMKETKGLGSGDRASKTVNKFLNTLLDAQNKGYSQ
mgnify:CR=1 FL=1